MKRILLILLFLSGFTLSRADEGRCEFLLVPRVSLSGFSTRDGNSIEPSNTLLYSIFRAKLTDNLTFVSQNRWASSSWEKTRSLYTRLGHADDVNFFDFCKLRLDVGRFNFQIGKDTMVYGDYTFDLYAFDFFPDLCDTYVAIYQPYLWGVSAGFAATERSEFRLQLTDTPYSDRIFDSGCLALTGIWNYSGEILSTIYTFTLHQKPSLPGLDGETLMKYLALGHMVKQGPWYGELNLAARFGQWRHFFGQELSASAKAGMSVHPKLDVVASFGWECSRLGESEWVYGPTWNCPGSIVPMAVYPDRDLWVGALYAYWFPLADRSLRLHLMGAANNYAEGGSLALGATWFLKFRF